MQCLVVPRCAFRVLTLIQTSSYCQPRAPERRSAARRRQRPSGHGGSSSPIVPTWPAPLMNSRGGIDRVRHARTGAPGRVRRRQAAIDRVAGHRAAGPRQGVSGCTRAMDISEAQLTVETEASASGDESDATATDGGCCVKGVLSGGFKTMPVCPRTSLLVTGIRCCCCRRT